MGGTGDGLHSQERSGATKDQSFSPQFSSYGSDGQTGTAGACSGDLCSGGPAQVILGQVISGQVVSAQVACKT